MSAAKHTPGPTIYTPWHTEGDVPAPWVAEDTDTQCVVRDANGGFVADCTNGFDGDEGWVMSAAVGPLSSLIAAAPELLAALVRAERCIRGYTDSSKRECDLDGIRAAIAKATGSAA